jgi:hypothetical protein
VYHNVAEYAKLTNYVNGKLMNASGLKRITYSSYRLAPETLGHCSLAAFAELAKVAG